MIAHITSEIITCYVQIGPKIKSAQNLLKFGTFDTSNMPISVLMSKTIFIKYLQNIRPKLVSRLKVPMIYWSLRHLIFQICRSWLCCQNWFLLNIYPPLGRNWSQNQKCSEFIKVWQIWYFTYSGLEFDVKMIFIKYLPSVMPKSVLKLKVLRIYWNLVHLIFQILQSQFWCQKWFLWNIYYLPALHKICENTGFHWRVFSRIMTKSTILYIIRENTDQWRPVFSHVSHSVGPNCS